MFEKKRELDSRFGMRKRSHSIPKFVRKIWSSVLPVRDPWQSEGNRLRRVGVDVVGIRRTPRLLMLLMERLVSSGRRTWSIIVEGSCSTSVVPLLLLRRERVILTWRTLRLSGIVIGRVVGSRLDWNGVGGGGGRWTWI